MNEAVHNSVSQGLLAKLLAAENITVHVGNYKTAMFDVRNRLLCLPSWNVDSKKVSDLLVGHEVGHALYTPVDAIDTFKAMCPECPFSILNIVEDVRIERMIQDRYPGLISAFDGGYAYFLKHDRFRLDGRDPNSLGFADRLNLKAKCKSKIQIDFTVDEQIIFDRCHTAQTIEDVYAICIDVYEMIKNEKRPEPEPKGSTESDEIESADDDESENDFEDDDEIVQPPSDTTDEESEDKIDVPAPLGHDADIPKKKAQIPETRDYNTVNEELESPTLDALTESLESLHTDFGRALPVVTPSHETIMRRVISVKDVMTARIARHDYKATFLADPAIFKDWIVFKKETMRNIQFLITEFERKKSAFQYSRAKVSPTGDIDVDLLHSYKYEDHIFRSVTKLADAKNHGMMFFIDYSGSMALSIHDVINHTLNLVMFCRAVGIPFQVFGFTTPPKNDAAVDVERRHVPLNHLSMIKTNIFELLNSDMRLKDYELGCRHLRAQAYKRTFLKQPDALFVSPWEFMIGTPLNETLVAAHTLIKNFRKRHPVQKMNVMFLTDGEPNKMQYGLDDKQAENIQKSKSVATPTRFQMTLNGRDVFLSACQTHNYALLVENLKITCDCTMVGFFIASSEDAICVSGIASIRYSRARGWTDKAPGLWTTASKLVEGEVKRLRRERCLAIQDGYNYDGYILINSNFTAIHSDPEFSSDVDTKDVTASSTQNKLANDFKKFTMKKKSSRIILSKFADLIG